MWNSILANGEYYLFSSIHVALTEVNFVLNH